MRTGATGLDGLMVWSEVQFDAGGRAVRSTRPHVERDHGSQGTVRAEYDALDRVANVVSPSPSARGDRWVSYDYASVGRAASVEAGRWLGGAFPRHRRAVVETSSEASSAKLVKVFDTQGDLALSAQVSATQGEAVTTYERGVDGQPTRVTGPDNDVISLKYDVAGQRVRLLDSDSGRYLWAYDGLGRVSWSADNGTERSFAYDRIGRLVTEEFRAGLSTP